MRYFVIFGLKIKVDVDTKQLNYFCYPYEYESETFPSHATAVHFIRTKSKDESIVCTSIMEYTKEDITKFFGR